MEGGVGDRSISWFWTWVGRTDRTGSRAWGEAIFGEGSFGDSSSFGSGSSAGSSCVCTMLGATGSSGSSHADSCTVVGSSHAVGVRGSGSGGKINSSTFEGCSDRPGGGTEIGVSCVCPRAGGGVGVGFSCGRAMSAQDNPDVAGVFEGSLGSPGNGASGLACTAGDGVPLGFASTPHAGVDSAQFVPGV